MFRSALVADDKPPAETTICDTEFKIVSPEGANELGTYHIQAVTRESARTIEIAESMSLNYHGKEVEMKSIVTYEDTSPVSATAGTAETRIDGKLCLQGTVTFSAQTVDIACTGFLNRWMGAAVDPPQEFDRQDQPVPDRVLVFQSAIPTIGPRLLPMEGELKEIVFVEFPDDLGAPELVTFKEGYRLVREQPDENGEYSIKMYGTRSDDSIFHARFSKADQLVSMVTFGNLRFADGGMNKTK